MHEPVHNAGKRNGNGRGFGKLDYSFLQRGGLTELDRLTAVATVAADARFAWIGIPDGQQLRLRSRVGIRISQLFLSQSISKRVLATGEAVHEQDLKRYEWQSDTAIRQISVWPLEPEPGQVVGTFAVADDRNDRALESLGLLDAIAQFAGVVVHLAALRRTRRGNRLHWHKIWHLLSTDLRGMEDDINGGGPEAVSTRLLDLLDSMEAQLGQGNLRLPSLAQSPGGRQSDRQQMRARLMQLRSRLLAWEHSD